MSTVVENNIENVFTLPSEIVMNIGIASLYPFFIGKLLNYYLEIDKLDTKCGRYVFFDKENQNDQDYEICKDTLANREYNKFIILMIVGIFSILLSFYIKEQKISAGIGFGGLIMMLYTIVINWNTFNEPFKLIMIGSALSILIYLGIKFM